MAQPDQILISVAIKVLSALSRYSVTCYSDNLSTCTM